MVFTFGNALTVEEQSPFVLTNPPCDMSHQFKAGELEIVRKVLEVIERAAKLSTEDERPWLSFMDKFQLNILDEITSLESVKEKWQPESGDKMFYIGNNGRIYNGIHDPVVEWHREMAKIGNCFRTEEEAEVACAKFIKMLEG